MGMSYFYKYMPTDANVCNGCEFFESNGKKHKCKSSGNTSTEIKKLDETTMDCPELEVRENAGLDKKSKSKGGGIGSVIGEKIADATVGKAKRELKAAAMRDVGTISRNLKKFI